LQIKQWRRMFQRSGPRTFSKELLGCQKEYYIDTAVSTGNNRTSLSSNL